MDISRNARDGSKIRGLAQNELRDCAGGDCGSRLYEQPSVHFPLDGYLELGRNTLLHQLQPYWPTATALPQGVVHKDSIRRGGSGTALHRRGTGAAFIDRVP